MSPDITGPIPATETSHPYRCDDSVSLVGYIEEEYFLAGHADALDPDGGVLARAAPYRTRMLVRRPVDPARFSGTVHLEPFHNLAESTPTWSVARPSLTRRGDAWVGVTTSAGTFGEPGTRLGGGVSQLRTVDPERYASLSLHVFDQAPPRTAPPGPAGYDPEGMRWRLLLATAQGAGVVSDVAALVRDNHDASPLSGLDVTRVFASGWSQTGLFWATFLDHGHHEAERAIDGYLVAVAPGPAARPDGALLVNLLSEAEVVGTLEAGAGVADDSDTPRFRGYEVPGTFHLWTLGFGGPFDTADHGARHNDRSWSLLVHAVLANMEAWSRDDVPMPRAPRIARDANAPDGIARDAHGNALGGLRTAWVDVPSARYLPRCDCSPTVGEMRAFDEGELELLYGSPGEHADAWERAVDAMVRDGWLLPGDAEALRITPE